jgi:hypothetical protein
MTEPYEDLQEPAGRFKALAERLATWLEVDDEYLSTEMEDILAVIAEQAELRFFVDGTRNFGHQGSTVALMKRLIDLTRFSGRIVVVFADYGREGFGRTAEKLALMLTGVDPDCIAECVAEYGPCREIRFLEFSRRFELRRPIAFGFTGGADDMSVNYAAELNVRFFARIQPYRWDSEASRASDAYYQSSRIEQPDGHHLCLAEAYPEFRDLAFKSSRDHVRAVEAATWEWYGETQQFDADLKARTRNLKSIENLRGRGGGVGRGGISVWPIYGLQHFREDAAEIIFHCALSAIQIQAWSRRTIVLLSLSPVGELLGWSDLIEGLALDLRSDCGAPRALRTALRRRYDRQFRDGTFASRHLDILVDAFAARRGRLGDVGVTVHHGYDASGNRYLDISRQLVESIGDAETSDVHVVELGPVPMDLFNSCLARSEIPALVEGQGTVGFMTGLGRPFLQLARAKYGVSNVDVNVIVSDGRGEESGIAKETQLIAQKIRDMQMASCLRAETPIDPSIYFNSVDQTGAFILTCGDLDSPVSRYFKSVGRYFSKNVHDRLLMSLLALRELALAGYE